MLPPELEEQIGKPMCLGETVRIVHSTCSTGKSPALSVRRTDTGWVWYCFRCSYAGFKSSSNLSPSEILSSCARLKNKPTQAVEHVAVPSDFIPITEDTRSSIYPDALGWLWKYHLSLETVKKFEVGWSPHYFRIIFPVYNTELLQNITGAKSLIGWFGRDPIARSKEDRAKLTIPKWLIRKSKGLLNFYYHIPSSSNRKCRFGCVGPGYRAHAEMFQYSRADRRSPDRAFPNHPAH